MMRSQQCLFLLRPSGPNYKMSNGNRWGMRKESMVTQPVSTERMSPCVKDIKYQKEKKQKTINVDKWNFYRLKCLIIRVTCSRTTYWTYIWPLLCIFSMFTIFVVSMESLMFIPAVNVRSAYIFIYFIFNILDYRAQYYNNYILAHRE